MGYEDYHYRSEDHPNLASARNMLRDAEKALNILRNERVRLLAEFEKKWDAEHGAEVKQLESRVRSYEAACSAEAGKIRLSEAASTLPYPEGTVVEEMKSTMFGSGRVATGKKGVIQIFRAGDAYPKNLAEYSIPDVGSIVVRELTKDGKPGLVVKPLRSGWSPWYKDGKQVMVKEKGDVTDAEV